MHAFVSLNYEILRPQAARLGAITASTLCGQGVFTTLAIYAGRPFLWDKHWSRLKNDASRLGMDLSAHPETKTKNQLINLLSMNGVKNGRARITFLDESPTGLWKYEATRGVTLLITTALFRSKPVSVRLTASPYSINSVSPLAGVKSCNYLEKSMTKREARRRGFDEAIQLNERKEVASATMANVFWLKNGALFTPALQTGCLPGTTREFVLENLECEEVAVPIEELRDADEIFLTSAGIGVVQVAVFDGKELARNQHPITELITGY